MYKYSAFERVDLFSYKSTCYFLMIFSSPPSSIYYIYQKLFWRCSSLFDVLYVSIIKFLLYHTPQFLVNWIPFLCWLNCHYCHAYYKWIVKEVDDIDATILSFNSLIPCCREVTVCKFLFSVSLSLTSYLFHVGDLYYVT